MSEAAGSTRRVMTRLAERHYAHLGPGYVADTRRASFGETGSSRRGQYEGRGEGAPVPLAMRSDQFRSQGYCGLL